MLLNLGEASYWSGYLAFLRADYDTAQSHWQRYRRVAERAAALEPDRARAWIETSYALNTLGTLSRKRERHAEALALFERSEQYKRRALRFEPDNLRLRADLADSLSWSARTLDRLGRLDEAQRRYAQAIATIAQVRRQAPLDAEWMHREAILRSSDGQILASLQRTPDARAEFEAAAALLDRIGGEQPERSDWTRDRLACRLSAAELELHDGRGAAARAHLEFADDALQALLAADASVQDLPRLRLRAALALARLEFADAGAKAARAPWPRPRPWPARPPTRPRRWRRRTGCCARSCGCCARRSRAATTPLAPTSHLPKPRAGSAIRPATIARPPMLGVASMPCPPRARPSRPRAERLSCTQRKDRP
ncbi:tetratricopeptide repeat protein [Lysobacter enzymogenes]|uniref:tetratricopeptide repeat protein n=1 Tax=Lysobacter enzymogenes TaxID=69 RepID=UPI0022653020|nr:tetratricopeptide repeat protein [Lysobacter enzymogenes]UZW60085.1 tetratricopeptide repeat protein [Lysobacter enzymogenes]